LTLALSLSLTTSALSQEIVKKFPDKSITAEPVGTGEKVCPKGAHVAAIVYENEDHTYRKEIYLLVGSDALLFAVSIFSEQQVFGVFILQPNRTIKRFGANDLKKLRAVCDDAQALLDKK